MDEARRSEGEKNDNEAGPSASTSSNVQPNQPRAANYCKLLMLLDKIAEELRKLYKELWGMSSYELFVTWDVDRVDRPEPWPFNHEMSFRNFRRILDPNSVRKFKTSRISDWDIALLVKASSKVADNVKNKQGNYINFNTTTYSVEEMKRMLDEIRIQRNELAHIGKMKFSDSEFQEKWQRLRRIAKYFRVSSAKLDKIHDELCS